MTSRFTAKALRPGSKEVEFLKEFLDFLSSWESHAKGVGGFLSDSTADGLRVTVSSTLALLDYLTAHGFSYLMTSRLSQDPLENLFGIVRQSSGSNDHPTPTQFLIIVNCLSFYNLAKVASSGNAEVNEDVSSLLNASDGSTAEAKVAEIDKQIEAGNLGSAECLLRSVPSEHKAYVEQKSDSRLIHYMAGYVARRFLARSNCSECRRLFLGSSSDEENCGFTKICDKGGLLYPSHALFLAVKKLEDIFTFFFSKTKLCSNSIVDIMLLVESRFRHTIGCSQHASVLTAALVKFYVLTRLHFYVKGLNQSRESRRKKKMHTKISRCS